MRERDMHVDKQQTQHISTEDSDAMSTLAPARENDTYTTAEESTESHPIGAAGLSIILGQMVAYFSGRAHVDDMDVLSFSLHHLFCHLDYLYHTVLPELFNIASADQSPVSELLQRQH